MFDYHTPLEMLQKELNNDNLYNIIINMQRKLMLNLFQFPY